MKKLFALIISVLLTSNSFAATTTDSGEVSVSVEILDSCRFLSGVFNGNFGDVNAGTVPTTSVAISWFCSPGITMYSILPLNTTISKTNTLTNASEDLVLSAYKDNAFSNQMTTSSGFSGAGNGQVTTENIYFKLTGKGPDLGLGNVVVEPVNFNNQTNALVYPLHLQYN